MATGEEIAARARLEALVEELGTVTVIDPREDFRAAEIGLGFDGRMIYSREALAECFATRDGMAIEDAEEWIDFNIVSTGLVLVID